MFDCNHCCSGKEISVTYSESVFVVLCIQHAKRVRRIMSSVDCPDLQCISTLSYKDMIFQNIIKHKYFFFYKYHKYFSF
jgi:hypothetical protein